MYAYTQRVNWYWTGSEPPSVCVHTHVLFKLDWNQYQCGCESASGLVTSGWSFDSKNIQLGCKAMIFKTVPVAELGWLFFHHQQTINLLVVMWWAWAQSLLHASSGQQLHAACKGLPSACKTMQTACPDEWPPFFYEQSGMWAGDLTVLLGLVNTVETTVLLGVVNTVGTNCITRCGHAERDHCITRCGQYCRDHCITRCGQYCRDHCITRCGQRGTTVLLCWPQKDITMHSLWESTSSSHSPLSLLPDGLKSQPQAHSVAKLEVLTCRDGERAGEGETETGRERLGEMQMGRGA